MLTDCAMILWGIIQLVGVLKNIIAKPTFIYFRWECSLTGYRTASQTDTGPTLAWSSSLIRGHTVRMIYASYCPSNIRFWETWLPPDRQGYWTRNIRLGVSNFRQTAKDAVLTKYTRTESNRILNEGWRALCALFR